MAALNNKFTADAEREMVVELNRDAYSTALNINQTTSHTSTA